jgi:hypothetical protein
MVFPREKAIKPTSATGSKRGFPKTSVLEQAQVSRNQLTKTGGGRIIKKRNSGPFGPVNS